MLLPLSGSNPLFPSQKKMHPRKMAENELHLLVLSADFFYYKYIVRLDIAHDPPEPEQKRVGFIALNDSPSNNSAKDNSSR